MRQSAVDFLSSDPIGKRRDTPPETCELMVSEHIAQFRPIGRSMTDVANTELPRYPEICLAIVGFRQCCHHIEQGLTSACANIEVPRYFQWVSSTGG